MLELIFGVLEAISMIILEPVCGSIDTSVHAKLAGTMPEGDPRWIALTTIDVIAILVGAV
jgi:hypothetical protein